MFMKDEKTASDLFPNRFREVYENSESIESQEPSAGFSKDLEPVGSEFESSNESHDRERSFGFQKRLNEAQSGSGWRDGTAANKLEHSYPSVADNASSQRLERSNRLVLDSTNQADFESSRRRRKRIREELKQRHKSEGTWEKTEHDSNSRAIDNPSRLDGRAKKLNKWGDEME